MLWVAAIGGCLTVIVLWQLATIAALRLFGIALPFSVAFHIHPRRERELLAFLKGRSKDTFVLISGLLLLACPLFAGLAVYDYIFDLPVDHPANRLDYIVGMAVVFGVMAACGIWTSSSSWDKTFRDRSPRP